MGMCSVVGVAMGSVAPPPQECELYMVAAAATSLVVDVQCDGCQTIVRNGSRFYHNMDLKSQSFDLCPTCFKSEPDHSPLEQLPISFPPQMAQAADQTTTPLTSSTSA